VAKRRFGGGVYGHPRVFRLKDGSGAGQRGDRLGVLRGRGAREKTVAPMAARLMGRVAAEWRSADVGSVLYHGRGGGGVEEGRRGVTDRVVEGLWVPGSGEGGCRGLRRG